MNPFPAKEESVSPISSPQTSYYYVPHQLCTVPEDETLSCAEFSPVQPSPSTLNDGRTGAEVPPYSTRDHEYSSKCPEREEAAAWFEEEPQKSLEQGRRSRATRWIMLARLVLLVVNLAGSTAILAVLVQALLSHQKLRHMGQLNGADNVWPNNMSFTSTTVLLFVAGTSIVKTATFLVADLLHGTRPRSNLFLAIMTTSAVLMAAAWVVSIVFAEIDRQNNKNFAAWACARLDGAVCKRQVRLPHIPSPFLKGTNTDADCSIPAGCRGSCYRDVAWYRLCRPGYPEQVPSATW